MTESAPHVVLGSRSPRRLELIRRVVRPEHVEVVPPRSSDEPGFEDAHDWPSIELRLLEIARIKFDDVADQLAHNGAVQGLNFPTIVTADTVVVVSPSNGRLTVLGQPPQTADDSWRDEVRVWFREYFAGRTHTVATGLCVRHPSGARAERVVKTQVTFHADVDRWLDWYLDSGEPLGKAGGYAIQEAGDLFICGVSGSLSNVVGLPLRDLLELFDELKAPLPRRGS
jgi:septum formation protein